MTIFNSISYLNQKIKIINSNINRKRIYHFLHIGKTGGSAINYALRNHMVGSDYKIYFHKHNFVLSNVPTGEKIMFFLRNPIQRFISGFYSRKRQGRPLYNSPWTKNEKISFENFSTPNELAIALSSIDLKKKKMANFAMNHIYHVKDSYWKWFQSEEYLRSRLSDICLIGFQEELEEDFKLLKSIVGLPESVKLPDDEVLAHKTPNEFDLFLEDEAILNLQTWYRDEFKLVELCRQFRCYQDSLMPT